MNNINRNSHPSSADQARKDKETTAGINTSVEGMIMYRVDRRTVKFFRSQEKLDKYKRSFCRKK